MADITSLITGALSSSVGSTPAVQQTRARLGVVAHDGYAALDTYRAWQPVIFGASLVGLAVSVYALVKRKQVGEALVLYSATAVASAATAWVTRPWSSAASAAVASDPNASSGGVMAMLDARAAALAAQDPQFAAKSLGRLLTDVGADKISPAIRSLLAS
jgi:hypothetical protein